MPTLTWSVRFAVDDADANAMSAVGHLVAVEREVRGLHFEAPPQTDPDGPATVTFELVERDAKSARLLAQYFLSKAKRAAGLKDDWSPVVWVAVLASTTESSGHRFLDAARELVDAEHYDIAVVAAQIHLEAHVAVLARASAINAEQTGDAVSAHEQKRRGWPPHRLQTRRLLEPLFGVEMHRFPRWAEYLAHVSRRNDVVHHGRAVDRDSALTSLEIVQSFWLWLNEAATAKGLT